MARLLLTLRVTPTRSARDMATPDELPAEKDLDRGGRQMSARESRPADRELPQDRPRRADAPGGAGPAAGGTAELEAYEHPETAMGGADAVQKTSWGVGHGAEPDGREEYARVGQRKGEGPVVARSDAGGGLNPIAWVAVLLAALAAILYGAGIFTG